MRNGAGTFTHRALPDIGNHGTGNSPEINAGVVVETTILSGDEGLFHELGHLPGFQLLSCRWPQFLDHLTVAGQQCDRSGAVEIGDPSRVRQGCIDQIGQRASPECCARTDSCCSGADQDPTQMGAIHITWVRGLWPMARAVTNMPSTRNGCALAWYFTSNATGSRSSQMS